MCVWRRNTHTQACVVVFLVETEKEEEEEERREGRSVKDGWLWLRSLFFFCFFFPHARRPVTWLAALALRGQNGKCEKPESRWSCNWNAPKLTPSMQMLACLRTDPGELAEVTDLWPLTAHDAWNLLSESIKLLASFTGNSVKLKYS